jgi:tetratricopeptide (TPR) repeat protein|tara:strand:+ start:172 stop:609 length:438 start_codon:yes stop_codon:yes gene_type:complete
MVKRNSLLLITFIFFIFINVLNAENNFFEKGKEKYNNKNLEEAKFLFQRSITFNPKKAEAYLYLAKIYNFENNENEEEKNVETVLLLEPQNEEAIFMSMKIELKKSNYTEVKKSLKFFLKICKKLCEEEKSIVESLKNLEPKNEF